MDQTRSKRQHNCADTVVYTQASADITCYCFFTYFAHIDIYPVSDSYLNIVSLNRLMAVFHFFFLLFILLLHQLSQHFFLFPIVFLDNYLDPFIFGATVPFVYLWEQRILWKKDKTYFLPIWVLFCLFIILSFVSEILLPYVNPKYTQDIWDVLSIGLGVIWFKLFLNK